MTPEQAGELSLAEQHEWFAAKHSRRRILRGGLVGAGAIAGTALIGNGVASAAPAAGTNVIAAGERVHGSAVAPYGWHINFGTDPIRAGQSTGIADIGATIDPIKQGTTYVVAGGGGDSVYSFPVADNHQGNRTPNTTPVPMVLNRPGKTTETVDVAWSRVRYTGYGLIAIDVAPAQSGRQTTMTAQALTESGTEVDRFTLVRKAK
jgi:hypothetical protein